MAKTVNYTPEMETELRSVYSAAETKESRDSAVVKMAEKFGKTPASIRQKLVRMGIYQKAEYTGKTGEKPETKEAIVSEIAEALNVNAEVMESLAKANKAVLKLLREALSD